MDLSSMMEALRLIQHELLLACVAFFGLGALDDLGFDLAYLWMRLTGRIQSAMPLSLDAPQSGPLAIFVPAWQEAAVIGATIARMQTLWDKQDYTLFVGCYHNDPDTIAAAERAIEHPERVKIIINPATGPTTKGDCLNCLWHALHEAEALVHTRFIGVVLHDSEDYVHADQLQLFRHYLPHHAMIQTPVVPFIPADKHWVAGHYADEFAESHGKTLRVRNALGGSLPAAGVGCAFDREMLRFIAQERGGDPFSRDSLVEDYELGLLIHELGGKPMLAYHCDEQGALIATRALFPKSFSGAVRQKTRWLTGIALAGWDRMGWGSGFIEFWMRLHDRRSIAAAAIVALGYILALITLALWALEWTASDTSHAPIVHPALRVLAGLCFGTLLWRMALRAWLVAQIYGIQQGFLSILRQFIANGVAILSAGRAVVAYTRHCFGQPLKWDKTAHSALDHGQMQMESTRNVMARRG
jgi:bacteriophage N4 adsorption protein B